MSEAITKAQDCGIELQKGATMIETQATADMLLMTHPFSAPAEKAEPVEVALVRAVLEGERDRFARLYEMYAPMVHGVLLARVPRDEVDDLVQDIFLHALKKLHTLRDAAAFGPWIAMIARNRAMDFYRSSRATVEVTEQMAWPKRQAGPRASFGFDQATPGRVPRDFGPEICRGMTGPRSLRAPV
jgi:RNA polymerase sigma-70 factor (ECF subfamily)